MPHLDANGLRFHVQVLAPRPGAGEAPPRPKVVMVHGLVLASLGSYYYTIANPLALVADVHLYDLRGHGRSEMPRSGYAVADHVADLDGLLAAWSIDEPVHLVSNSFGGVIALEFARRFPAKVASLVMVESHFATEGWGEWVAGSLALAAFGLDEQEVRDWLAHQGTRKHNRLARLGERLIYETSLVSDLQAERPFPRGALEALACPVLALYGERSDILARGRDLERLVPECELHVVPGATHELLAEAAPYVRDQVAAWLRRHGTAAGGGGGDARHVAAGG